MQRYQQAIINDKVPLSIFDLVLFYTSSLFALVVGLIFFYRINFTDFKFDTTNQAIILNIFSIVFIAFGIYTAILNRQHFKFKFIESSKSKEEKEKIILGIANKSNWTLIKKDTNNFKFTDTFSWSKWRYNITVIYDDNGFYVNALTTQWKPIDRGTGKKIALETVDKIKGCL
ncbi:MAG TPA: hypothetical protein PKM63_17915 [Panacibacter sp.]|nr:hypothetical protein [Panacibacter sp.]HNP46176.1 hypothetical protein [Panacibacter sp.]